MNPPWSVRWAARYAFVDELWRGKARVVVDPALEAVLRDAGPGVAHGSDPALRALLDDLLPREPVDGEPVWMAVATATVAADLGPQRPGTTFVPLEGIADVLTRAHWGVAMIDLGADFDASGGPPGHQAENALDELGLDDHDGRAIVLSAPVRDYPRSEVGLDYNEMADLVADRLGGGRLYGLFVPPMAAVVEFGDATADEEVDDQQTVEIREDEEVPLTYDNTLGSQDPVLLEFIAVVGAAAPIEGLALVELPPVDDDEEDEGGARAQLQQARRRADLAAIDRQAQLERAEALERDNVELRRQLELDGPRPSAEPTGDLEAALAREQALKWQVTELEHALRQALSRPVEELEAEVARLKARLTEPTLPTAPPAPLEATAPDVTLLGGERPLVPAAKPSPSPGPAVPSAAIAAVDALVRRVERGGIGVLELRRKLVDLRRRLRVS